ncbi:hypothetical protein [Rosistilla oblonga]|uniref:hypothetical protein n=1 Tax=Rosistilla oblonga TaxID=2527990 RepID=UPI003A9751FB
MRRWHSYTCWVFSLTFALASASTNREAKAEAQWFLSTGAWVPVLPDYKAVAKTSATPVNDVFVDDQTGVGAQLTLGGFYRFGETRTMFESDLQIAGAGSIGSSQTFSDAVPGENYWFPSLDGLGTIAAGSFNPMAVKVDSDVFHLHKYVGLRDHFSLDWIGLGDITIGCGFSWMSFDQDFQTDARIEAGPRGQYIEDLDTNYLGGEFRGTLRQSIFGQICYFDARYGIYEMDADYFGTSRIYLGTGALFSESQVSAGLKQTTTTVDLAVRTDVCVAGWWVRPSIGFKYFDDMAQIVHPQRPSNSPTTLATDSAYIFNGSLEFVF